MEVWGKRTCLRFGVSVQARECVLVCCPIILKLIRELRWLHHYCIQNTSPLLFLTLFLHQELLPFISFLVSNLPTGGISAFFLFFIFFWFVFCIVLQLWVRWFDRCSYWQFTQNVWSAPLKVLLCHRSQCKTCSTERVTRQHGEHTQRNAPLSPPSGNQHLFV